ncbi:hypothetical protein Xcaj_08895 [Xanthomonas axonopodis pv. cajani]|uniref:Uncharacterized protein n=1 Tax=Xanthomonas axonopodis pv. cajani TaxID=487827 RepID=A0ABX3MBE9_9XANT|nr:hypothetical protein Xcaj_08895 [Xanthomonas axonopodis pv. cajani]
MSVSPFAKIHDDDLDHRLLNRFSFGVPPAHRIPDVAGIGMPKQSAQPTFWDPLAGRRNQIAASQSPARPRAGQFHMVRDDAPM